MYRHHADFRVHSRQFCKQQSMNQNGIAFIMSKTIELKKVSLVDISLGSILKTVNMMNHSFVQIINLSSLKSACNQWRVWFISINSWLHKSTKVNWFPPLFSLQNKQISSWTFLWFYTNKNISFPFSDNKTFEFQN